MVLGFSRSLFDLYLTGDLSEYPVICKLRLTGEYFVPFSVSYVLRHYTCLFKGMDGSYCNKGYDFKDVVTISNPFFKGSIKPMCWRDRELLRVMLHLKNNSELYTYIEVLDISIGNRDTATVTYKKKFTGIVYVLSIKKYNSSTVLGYSNSGVIRIKGSDRLGKLYRCLSVRCVGTKSISELIALYLQKICSSGTF